jgi:NAD(P)-dependent dehydrogenase (short-subunit alcohol dehydrogenase family)
MPLSHTDVRRILAILDIAEHLKMDVTAGEFELHARKPGASAAVTRLSPNTPACGLSLDVREPQWVADALAELAQERGKTDVLVSCAAGNFPAAAASLSPNGFKAVVDIDLLGTFHVPATVTRYHSERGSP